MEKFAFATCVQLGLSCMEEIYLAGGKLDIVICLNDELAKHKSGRVFVDDFCKEKGIELIKVKNINEEKVICRLDELKIDWLFIIGWSQIAKKTLLEIPSKGAIGMHPTLLPIGRGRASIPWAILKKLSETGVSLFKMDEGVDTGPIIYQEHVSIEIDETATKLYEKVNQAHRTLIRNIWNDLQNDNIILYVQDETKATYWDGRTPADGEINKDMTVDEVDRLVRATTHPYPGAFWLTENMKIIIWEGTFEIKSSTVNSKTLKIDLKDGCYFITNYERILVSTDV